MIKKCVAVFAGFLFAVSTFAATCGFDQTCFVLPVQLQGGATVTGNISATGTGSMPLYTTAGVADNAPHEVAGTVTLSGGTATVTLTAPASYSAAGNYVCNANDTTAANAVKVSNTSGTQFVITGTTTDVIAFGCTGF